MDMKNTYFNIGGIAMTKEIKTGDVLLYVGDEGEQIGVVKAVDVNNGQVRVGSGYKSVTVQPHSFIEIIPATERTIRMAEYLNR
jgi:transcription elongation factor